MAKKSNKRRDTRLSEAQRYAPQAAPEAASAARVGDEADLAAEYRYVFTDLKGLAYWPW